MALFGEKYGDAVRMVKVCAEDEDDDAVSIELCGGTHVKSTGLLGVFRIVSETGIASGVRRIEAETSRAAIQRARDESSALAEAAEILKATPQNLPEKVRALFAERKELLKEITKAKAAAAEGQQGETIEKILNAAEKVNGISLIAAKLDGYDIEALRKLGDKLKAEVKSGAILLCGVNGTAVQFLASATEDAVSAGINAGLIVKKAATICGGGGGGKPNHAQAGGKDATRANEALTTAMEEMKQMLQ